VLVLNAVSKAVLIFIKNPMANAHRILTSIKDRSADH